MRRQQLFFSFGLGLICAIALSGVWLSPFKDSSGATLFESSSAFAQSPPNSVLVARSHALPASLATWQPKQDSSDYFEAIPKLPLGYLIWSDRPVSVSIEPSHFNDLSRQQAWERNVNAAIREWQTYFPIQVTQDHQADIIIKQERPRKTSQGLARSAQATPEPYCNGDRIQHRFLIQVNPSQTGRFIQSATRHELGHALGIWGHSPNPQDVLYERQVANPPPISERDINTLKKIYQQPTLLGWPAPQYCPHASS